MEIRKQIKNWKMNLFYYNKKIFRHYQRQPLQVLQKL